jgi:acetylornithine deacetylase/succinyl-diaminopimelate desuccinylase-like protein
VVLFIEGEEESGSPTFETLLAEHRDSLQSDVIVVADSDNPSPDIPALTTSLRGVVGVTVTVTTGHYPLHSGMFGGVIPDAPTALIRLLSTLHNDEGDCVLSFDLPDDRPSQKFDESSLRKEAGVLPGVELMGSGSVSDRLWWKPAITITGFDAPATAMASNTLWPQASARVSMRVPPTVSPDDAYEVLCAHLTSLAPWGVSVSFSAVEKGPGFVGSTDHPHAALFAECAEAVFGNPLRFQGVGGAIPFISLLSEVFPEAAVLVTGVEDPESRAHGTNESVDLAMLRRTGLTEAFFFARLSQLG